MVNGDIRHVKRGQGEVLSPEAVLKSKQGACRDMTVLFVEACRTKGLARRFVSGYIHGKETEEGELNAWAEVYLPGTGWRGVDPTHGLFVNDQYAALAAPVSDSFRGTGARSKKARKRSQTGNLIWQYDLYIFYFMKVFVQSHE